MLQNRIWINSYLLWFHERAWFNVCLDFLLFDEFRRASAYNEMQVEAWLDYRQDIGYDAHLIQTFHLNNEKNYNKR